MFLTVPPSFPDFFQSEDSYQKPILEVLSSISEASPFQVRSFGNTLLSEQQTGGVKSMVMQPTSSRSSSLGSFPCLQCGKMYMWKTNLQRHLRLECGKEPQCKCPYCPHKTNRKDVLLTHVKLVHKTSNLFPVDFNS